MFNPNFITRLITTALALPMAVGAMDAQAAQAYEAQRCGRLAGFNVCAVDRGYVDSLSLKWDNGAYTHIAVRCGNRTFNTTLGARYITYRQAQAITTQWCRG